MMGVTRWTEKRASATDGTRLSVGLVRLLLAIALLLAGALSEHRSDAAISSVGAVDPTSGLPISYKDANGLALKLCTTGANCVTTGDQLERYYFLADAVLNVGNGGTARMKMALVANYLAPNVTAGQEATVGRVSLTVDRGLTPGSTYVATHPYGTVTGVADNSGAITSVTSIGCTAAPCDFSSALSTAIGPFLTAVSPAPPTGFIGNPAVQQTVTGSPLGTNYFRMEGPNVNGLGGTLKQTNQWSLMGQKAFQAIADTVTVPAGATQVPVPVLANDVVSLGESVVISSIPITPT